MRNSKRIGADAERRVAKIIRGCNKVLTAEDCRRTGYEQSRKKGIRDLHLSKRVVRYFPFSVEVKKLRSWNPFAFMRTPCPHEKWFVQTVEQARNVKLKPLLVIVAQGRACYACYRLRDRKPKWPKLLQSPTMIFPVGKTLWVMIRFEPFAKHFLARAKFTGRDKKV